ncbi:hypothetical protein BDZ91DRAFT_716345 [Kalaharituber pfeilii]|nr:hypothetical protein BDZ91DRAFT_716345 [Kalaharituber pfeilii]
MTMQLPTHLSQTSRPRSCSLTSASCEAIPSIHSSASGENQCCFYRGLASIFLYDRGVPSVGFG